MAEYTKQDIFNIITEYLGLYGSAIGSNSVRELTQAELTDATLRTLTIPSVLPNTEEWVCTSLRNMLNPIDSAVSDLVTLKQQTADARDAALDAADDVENLIRGSEQPIDFAVSDYDGNEIVQFKNGHVKTKEFDSEEAASKEEVSNIDKKYSPRTTEISDFAISDYNGNFIIEIQEGYPVTKKFDGRKQIPTNFMHKKSVWWCGTSIPAGDGGETAVTPNYIYNYPKIVGKIIGSKDVWNEAVGSSQANGNTADISSESYERYSRRMGHTVAEKISMIEAIWNIDYVNQTFSRTGSVQVPSSIPEPSDWNSFIGVLFRAISCSFEIKLVAKYLISDTTEHENYINTLFSGHTDMLAAINSYIASQWYGGGGGKDCYSFDYKDDIDLFVIDHIHNDEPTSLIPDNEISSRDRSTFWGAINTWIDLIYTYKGQAKIVFIGDYSNYTDTQKVIECQKQICEYRGIPLLSVHENLPFGRNKITTRGYWDDENVYPNWPLYTGEFHNQGFTFTYQSLSDTNWVTNDTVISDIGGNAGKSAEEVIQKYNIRTINGVLVHDLPQRQLFFKDGIHPSTDWTHRAISMYANAIVSKLISIS